MSTRRIAPGAYEVEAEGFTVTLTRHDHLGGRWVAAAGWDRHLLTDPLPTKRAAKAEAEAMLAERLA